MPSKITIAIPALQTTITKFVQLNGNLPKTVAQGMNNWAEPTLTEAKKRTPVAPQGGTLRGSLRQRTKINGMKIQSTFDAGDAAKAYALAVHEHLSRHSPPSWRRKVNLNWNVPGTGPKYLENPINERMPKLDGEISQQLDKELRKTMGVL